MASRPLTRSTIAFLAGIPDPTAGAALNEPGSCNAVLDLFAIDGMTAAPATAVVAMAWILDQRVVSAKKLMTRPENFLRHIRAARKSNLQT
jgi:hypothetical protein